MSEIELEITDEEKRLASFRLSHYKFVQECNKHLGPLLYIDNYNKLTNREMIDTIIAADNASIIEIKNVKIQLAGDGLYIAKLLSELSYITTLDLNQAGIHNKELEPIAAALRRNNTLTRLNLNNNHISYEGLVVLTAALSYNTSLQTLALKNNIIRSQGAATLFSTKNNLHHLDLENNQIGPLGYKDYKDWIVNNSLISLNLRLNNINATSGQLLAEFLKHQTSIQQLDLSQCQLGYTGLQYITEALKFNSTLRELLLNDNDLCSTSVTLLASLLAVNNSIRKIDLSHNDANREGAIALASALTVNTGLTNLNLAHNSLDCHAVRQIASMLTQNSTLLSLDLNNNPIRDEGLAAILLALKYNKTLLHLDLTKAYIYDYRALCQDMTRTNERYLARNKPAKHDISIYINLAGCNYFNHLEILNLSDCNMGIESALAISTMLKVIRPLWS